MSAKFTAISDFIINNKLKLNDEKNHLMVMTTSQKRKKGNPKRKRCAHGHGGSTSAPLNIDVPGIWTIDIRRL